MTPRVIAITRSPQKGVRESLLRCTVTAEGIEGDRAGGGKRQLSLLAGEAQAALSGMDGLCTGRFQANIVTEGLDYAALPAGTRLRMGECMIEITEQGKRCFDECPLRKQGKTCPLPESCAFAKVLRGGGLCAGDRILL